MRVYTLTIRAGDEQVCGMKPGVYVVHVSEESVTIMLKPKGDTTFRVARVMEVEK